MESNLFIPLSIDPSLIRIFSFQELDETFGFELLSDPATPPDEDKPSPKSMVFLSHDHAVKILQDSDPDLSNELFVASKLNELASLTTVFVHCSGYVLSLELPPDVPCLETISIYEPGHGYVDLPASHYIYAFFRRVQHPFDALPDEPKINEDFFFEILIGIYHARKAFNFVHWDIHARNLMFNKTTKRTSRTYQISATFFVTIQDTNIEPKLIDYGKSAVDVEYSDNRWKESRFKKFWNKSDLYHLALIFSHQQNLSPKFKTFLQDKVLGPFANTMYARRLENDSASNHGIIEALLQEYFGAQTTIDCLVCKGPADYKEINNSFQYFCGVSCQAQFYK